MKLCITPKAALRCVPQHHVDVAEAWRNNTPVFGGTAIVTHRLCYKHFFRLATNLVKSLAATIR